MEETSLHNISYLFKRKTRISQGYFWIHYPTHPRANNYYVKRSVLILENKLGRHLREGEMVHHIDEDRLNDDPDNLEVTTRAEHMSHHKPILNRWNNCKEQA